MIIFIICKNKKEAGKIGLALLQKRLAGCIVVIPKVFSAYRWKGKVEKTSEAVLFVKTLKKKFREVEKEVVRLHSYEIPLVAALPVIKANKSYLAWLGKEI